MIVGIAVNGLVYGGIIAILAIGFSLVFGAAKILNFAHTAFYMAAAFTVYVVITSLGIPYLLAGAIAIAVAVILGLVCFQVFMDRIKQNQTAVMLVTVGLAMFIQEILTIVFSSTFYGVKPPLAGAVEIMGVHVSFQHMLAFSVAVLILYGTWLMLTRTKVGVAITAIADDMEIANLMGIDVSRLCLIAVGISAGLAGFAAVAVAPIFPIHSHMWMDPLTILLAAVVLGGLESVWGSVVGAFILGFVETAVVFLVPGGAFLRGAFSLAAMVAILWVKPEGLFGIVFEEERL